MRKIRVLRGAHPGTVACDTALSRVLLDAVGRGEFPECLRVWWPRDALAFSVLDRRREGFESAVRLARNAGFEPFLRLTGGHAAVYTAETLAFAWTLPARDSHRDVGARFDAIAELIAGTLRDLGVEARVGPVSGEYCPGAHSVNAGGRVKLMGVGQRVVRGAAHVGGVVVFGGAGRVRQVLEPVYAQLDLPFDPETVGAVEDEIPGIEALALENALVAGFRGHAELEECELSPDVLAQARHGEFRHRVAGP